MGSSPQSAGGGPRTDRQHCCRADQGNPGLHALSRHPDLPVLCGFVRSGRKVCSGRKVSQSSSTFRLRVADLGADDRRTPRGGRPRCGARTRSCTRDRSQSMGDGSVAGNSTADWPQVSWRNRTPNAADHHVPRHRAVRARGRTTGSTQRTAVRRPRTRRLNLFPRRIRP